MRPLAPRFLSPRPSRDPHRMPGPHDPANPEPRLSAWAQLGLKVRDRLIEIAGVDRAEHTTERRRTGACGDDGPHQPGLIFVHGFEPMVVMHVDGEESAHPLPSRRRVIYLHPERGRTPPTSRNEPVEWSV